MQSEEEKNKRIGMISSVGIHAALFLVFFFMVAWKAPNPPLPEYGIELNFGLDSQGSGDIQPTTPVGDENALKDDVPQEQPSESQANEVTPDVNEEIKVAVPEKPVEEAVSNIESPVSLKEKKKEVTPEETKEKSQESKSKETVIAVYKKDEKKAVDVTDASAKGAPGNQGDEVKKPGDKGSPAGKYDAKALYGIPGGGGGGNGMDLQMSGWAWADQPKIPELPDNENGKVVFEIECDESGEIIGINTMERSLSPRSEQILKNEIRKNSLVRTSGGRAPDRSKGRIVFILKTK